MPIGTAYIREKISIHALRGEGDAFALRLQADNFNDFNPRPPWGGRRRALHKNDRRVYFNPRPPWGGRPSQYSTLSRTMDISIHALRGEGDEKIKADTWYTLKFQSTPSVGRATNKCGNKPIRAKDFNPRPPWGGRLNAKIALNVVSQFQSTPSVGRATKENYMSYAPKQFQSTPSVGRATASSKSV